MRGLDPRIHLAEKKMDCRVKPGNDTSKMFDQNVKCSAQQKSPAISRRASQRL